LELSVDDEGQPYSITEFWPGVPLTRFAVAEWRKRAEQGTRLVGDLVAHVESALQYAHRSGTVHGSLTSANVLVARTAAGPAVKVLDFGHAALVGRLPRVPVRADDLRALDDLLRACRRHYGGR
jgi:serine/threonine protein kinase